MSRDRMEFLFLNADHFLDHPFMLIFATVAAVRLADEWGMSYAALIPYATPAFIAFGVGAIATRGAPCSPSSPACRRCSSPSCTG